MGATLLLALTVLALASGAAFQLHRTVVREGAMEGEALRGDQAALEADAALAGFLGEGWAGREGVFPLPEGEVRASALGEGWWKLRVEGRSRVWSGGKAVRTFIQVREAYVYAPPGAPPVLRAWRIVR